MIGGAGTVSGVPFERSVSSSRQFIVFGGDPRLRGAIADLAEHSKRNVLALLLTGDNWLVPILLNIEQPQANLPEMPRAALNFSQTGSGLKIQLDLLITPEVDPAIVERELVRSILLEIAYRGLPLLPAGVSYATPPDWLINGISTLRDESPATLAALESLGAHPMPLKDLLAQRPDLLDSQSANLYRAHAHPLLRPVVLDYQLMAQSLADKKWRGLSKRAAATVQLRERVSSRMGEADDFMNWFEATQASTSSGDFRDYLQAVRTTEELPRRRDALSVYLDAVELQFQ